MNTIETIEAIRAKYNGCTDYRISKLMGIDQNRISHYMHDNRTMTAEHRIIAAKLLNQDPATHLLYMEMERTDDPQIKRVWQNVIARMTATAAALVCAVIVTITPTDSQANSSGDQSVSNIHYAFIGYGVGNRPEM